MGYIPKAKDTDKLQTKGTVTGPAPIKEEAPKKGGKK